MLTVDGSLCAGIADVCRPADAGATERGREAIVVRRRLSLEYREAQESALVVV
jgi:hypothetical protein